MMTDSPLLSRRTLLLAAPAILVAKPLLAQESWTTVADRARGFEQIHAIVVSHRGEVVLAEAFRGPGLTQPANVKSVSKTIVAALTGAALDRHEITGVNDTLGEIALELIPARADPRVAGITVENLLTMQAGLERTSGANYGSWVSSSNWVANALSRPFVAEPGGRMLYSTGSYHVLGAVLAEVSGHSLLDQARSRLGEPLDISIPAWTRDPQGFYLGGNEMSLSPMAMLRFGEMYRQGGSLDGVRVLSEEWVRASLIPRTRSPYSGLDYGYGWFLGQRDGLALARGFGGQIIAIAPEQELTVAITSDPLRPARSEGYFGDLLDLLRGPVLSAARV